MGWVAAKSPYRSGDICLVDNGWILIYLRDSFTKEPHYIWDLMPPYPPNVVPTSPDWDDDEEEYDDEEDEFRSS